jgi:hypothetical protein
VIFQHSTSTSSALRFDDGDVDSLAPSLSTRRLRVRAARAATVAADWQARLAEWQLGAADVSALRNAIAPRMFTPVMIA